MSVTVIDFDALPLFKGVALPMRQALARLAVTRRFEAGEVLFTAGSAPRGLFIVLEGEVRVVRGREGRQHVVHMEGPGGTLGEVALFDGGGYPATAIASAPTSCLVFSVEAVRTAIAADPEVAWLFLRRMAGRMRHLVDRLDRLAGQGVTSRLAKFLSSRQREAGTPTFSLGRSQTQVAEELGTVREVLVRSLRSLREAGVIQWVGRGRYEIVDAQQLQRLGE